MCFTVDGMKMEHRSLQSAKARFPISFIPDGRITFAEVLRYAYPPILDTLGRILVVEQARIILFVALSTIELEPSDLYFAFPLSTVIALQFSLLRNAVESMYSTDAGICIDVTPLIRNAFSAIDLTPSTIVEPLPPAIKLLSELWIIALQSLRESYHTFLLSTIILVNDVRFDY